MGKVVRVGPERIDYWGAGEEQMHTLSWSDAL
jgi:hypothetical protein